MHFINSLISQYQIDEFMGNMGTKYVLLGITMATILGVYAITTTATTDSTVTSYGNTPFLMGHITMVVTGADGNIKSYFQTDNLITDEGRICGLVSLTGATDGCAGSAGDFQFIALSSNTTFAVGAGDTAATGWDTATEVARATAADSVTFFSDTQVDIVRLFNVGGEGSTAALDDGEVVSRTALFDDATFQDATNMLAYAELSDTTGVDGDDITITWSITG